MVKVIVSIITIMIHGKPLVAGNQKHDVTFKVCGEDYRASALTSQCLLGNCCCKDLISICTLKESIRRNRI